MTLFHPPSVQSPKAYDLANLQGAALGARLAAAAGATMRANLRTALQDTGFRYKIHPSETAQGLTEVNLTFGFDPGDVRRYGAVADGVTNDGPAFQTAIYVARQTTVLGVLTGVGGTVYVPRPTVIGKFYLITQALDLTISHEPNDPGLVIMGDGGALAGSNADVIVLKHTGHGFDLTGANRVNFINLSIGTDAVTFPKTCFYLARNNFNSPTNGAAGHHTFENVTVLGSFSNFILYNFASEDLKVTNCIFYQESGVAGSGVVCITGNNRFALHSTFIAEASTGGQSCIDHQFVGGEFLNNSTDAASDIFYLDQANFVKVLLPWVYCTGRSVIFLDGAFGSSNYGMLFGFQGEFGAGVNEPNTAITSTNDVATHVGWYIEHCSLPARTLAIDMKPNATCDTWYINQIFEQISRGMTFEGVVQNSEIHAGLMNLSITGNSKNNKLVGDSSRWTIPTRTDDNWDDMGSPNKTWTPVLGAGFTVTGALTVSNKKCLLFGNMCYVTASFSAATSIVSVAGAVITGLPKAAVVRAAATYVQSDTPAVAAPAAVSGSSIAVGAFTAGANVDVTVTAVYPIA
ncbi:MAG TPA: hypothetical protein VNH84_12700 [Candidatus Saccharimonadales bacterium]|nr:hypothetical protein [Candidatus Saccharimonadales bacterium]